MNLILNIDIIIWDGDCMDSINTPQDLLKFMDDIKYEWMDKKGNFHTELVPEMFTEYSLMSPEEVLKYKKGVCTDQSEFERDWFKKHNYNFDCQFHKEKKFWKNPRILNKNYYAYQKDE